MPYYSAIVTLLAVAFYFFLAPLWICAVRRDVWLGRFNFNRVAGWRLLASEKL